MDILGVAEQQAQRGLPQRVRRMVMLPGRV
jgi:hypothetical protein